MVASRKLLMYYTVEPLRVDTLPTADKVPVEIPIPTMHHIVQSSLRNHMKQYTVLQQNINNHYIEFLCESDVVEWSQEFLCTVRNLCDRGAY